MLDRADHLKSIQADREDLASAIRLAAYFNFHEGICNHFSVQCDGPEELYLINAYGWHWTEVTADRLLLIDGDGNVVDGQGEVEASARNIHIASHRANPRHKAIFHVHCPYATSISMLEGGRLLMAHQTAARFYGRIGYEEEFGGIAVTEEEGERIECLLLGRVGAILIFDDGRQKARGCIDVHDAAFVPGKVGVAGRPQTVGLLGPPSQPTAATG